MVRIFISVVQDRATGLGNEDCAANKRANGSPLRDAELCETSA
jgi:hypothetical protein